MAERRCIALQDANNTVSYNLNGEIMIMISPLGDATRLNSMCITEPMIIGIRFARQTHAHTHAGITKSVHFVTGLDAIDKCQTIVDAIRDR
jgi:hypothetical protein